MQRSSSRDLVFSNSKQAVKVKNYIYSKQCILGRGALSVVYKGINQGSKELVAIKRISKMSLTSEYLIDALLSEIELYKQIHSQHIVQMQDYFQTQENVYIVMDYCNFGTLRSLMQDKRKFTEREAIQIILAIVLGLNDLIEMGIAHRDLKPENILCRKDGDIISFCIGDLGFSKMKSSQEQMFQSSIGSLQYMDLNRLIGDKYTSKSDIFSLGIIFYELLFGEVPWKGSNLEDFKYLLISAPLKIPENNLSIEVKNFLKGSLAISEEQRFSWKDVRMHELFSIYYPNCKGKLLN